MYSPKISERLIPPLYRLARTRGQHMTTVVNEVLAAYLAVQDLHGVATVDSSAAALSVEDALHAAGVAAPAPRPAHARRRAA
jgi:hypothetical protein